MSRVSMNDLEVLDPMCSVFRRHLKSLGQKYTLERARILDVLLRMDDLFQADQLLDRVRKEGFKVSKATIYRTIKLLQEAGIIQQVLVESEHAHYMLAYGKKPRDLMVRTDTNQVFTIEVPELIALRDRLCRERGLVAVGHRFQVYATAR